MQNSITNYTIKLTKEQIEQLKQILKNKSWNFSNVPYAFWKASKEKVNVTAYNSGKLVIQGKGTEEFVLFILEPQVTKTPSLGYEDLDFSPHIGIDESGKGDFFGPLVIASAYVDNSSLKDLKNLGVSDSKTIKSEKKIADLSSEIKKIIKEKYSIVPIGPKAYNNLYTKMRSLNKLLAWGHARALENLLEKNIDCSWALSDKFADEKLIKNTLFKKGKDIELKQETKAESDIAVASASILASAEFSRRIRELEKQVNMEIPKGAGEKVLNAAVEIIRREGAEKLNLLSKTHFRTKQKALARASQS